MVSMKAMPKPRNQPFEAGTGQHDGADLFRDRGESVARLDHRSLLRVHRRFVLLVQFIVLPIVLRLRSALSLSSMLSAPDSGC